MSNPYYIIAPPYNNKSAGVRVLYELSNRILRLGYDAYIYNIPYGSMLLSSAPGYPIAYLNDSIINYHYENNKQPIVIYPETIHTSLFSNDYNVRYLLHYNNFLKKNIFTESDKLILSYSELIAQKESSSLNKKILFIPVCDTSFYKKNNKKLRFKNKTCYYAYKYKNNFNGKITHDTNNSIEITMKTSREEIRELFQTSEKFYCYEDSALAIEALLCGCPVVYVENQYFSEPLLKYELFNQNVVADKFFLDDFYNNIYMKHINNIDKVIMNFITETQLSVNSTYSNKFNINFKRPYLGLILVEGFMKVKEYFRLYGIIKMIDKIFKRIF